MSACFVLVLDSSQLNRPRNARQASTSYLAAVDRFDAIGRVENKFLDIGSTRDRRDSTDMIASRFV